MQGMDLEDLWFKQGIVMWHTAQNTIYLLHETFPGHVISQFSHQN